MDYLLLKFLHQTSITIFIVAMIIALAGLIFRHSMSPENWVKTAKILRIVAGIPSSIGIMLAFVLGIWMAIQIGWYEHVWFWLKMVAVLALSGVHGRVSNRYRKSRTDPISDTPASDIVVLVVFSGLVMMTFYLVYSKPFM